MVESKGSGALRARERIGRSVRCALMLATLITPVMVAPAQAQAVGGGDSASDAMADFEYILERLLADPSCDEDAANAIAESAKTGIESALDRVDAIIREPLSTMDLGCLDGLMDFNLDVFFPSLPNIDDMIGGMFDNLNDQVCSMVNDAFSEVTGQLDNLASFDLGSNIDFPPSDLLGGSNGFSGMSTSLQPPASNPGRLGSDPAPFLNPGSGSAGSNPPAGASEEVIEAWRSMIQGV